MCKQNIFTTSLTNYKKITQKCYVCSHKISSGELLILKYLNKNNIKFEWQKKFDGCKDKKPMPFEFYLTDYNCCVEFDGQQHFIAIDFMGGEEHLRYVQEHDKMKNQYCLDHNINILRIPYFKANKLADMITKKLLEITNTQNK